MPPYKTKLIVLRGNSGSGKTTVANHLRKKSSRKIAVVGQDAVRRGILGEKEADDAANIALIRQVAEFALARDYDVVLEGILKFSRYGSMLTDLAEKCSASYFYYFDISFEETLRRHETKPQAHEFGEREMRQWYAPQDFMRLPGEKIIPEDFSFEQTVRFILNDVGF